jgi:hypothetical protein
MDRTTKILLTAIAAGLWLNAAFFALRPAGATSTESDDGTSIRLAVVAIANGTCANHEICDQ